MASLTELANSHGTDKGTVGPSKTWPVHNYTDIYAAYLDHLRDEPINFLEIGLGVTGDAWQANVAHGRNETGGASIKTWYDYFPKATVYGVDINPASFLDNDRTRTFQLDQGNRAQLEEFADKAGVEFDVIIDDGSHRADHQQLTFSVLFPRLAPGGLYFIEDLMRNGVGDPDMGRFNSEHDVVNTRRLFGTYASDGTFPGPNDLIDGPALAGQIDSIVLHRPKVRVSGEVSFGVNSSRAMAGRLVTEYIPYTEQLCAIRKRGGRRL
jgi:hypothetical protein